MCFIIFFKSYSSCYFKQLLPVHHAVCILGSQFFPLQSTHHCLHSLTYCRAYQLTDRLQRSGIRMRERGAAGCWYVLHRSTPWMDMRGCGCLQSKQGLVSYCQISSNTQKRQEMWRILQDVRKKLRPAVVSCKHLSEDCADTSDKR